MVDDHTAPQVEEVLAFPLIACPRGFATLLMVSSVIIFSLFSS
jgi:hypothetical protein